MSELKDWLTLCHVRHLGPITFHKLLNEFGTPSAILGSGHSRLQSIGLSKQIIDGIISPDTQSISQDLEWLQNSSHHVITIQDKHYPKLLRQITDPPPVLYAIGEKEFVPQLLSEPQLAIVGSRNATINGKQIATDFAQKIAESGLVITSGLASGIDGAAHKGALIPQSGATIAVTACGLDRVYPANHKLLAEQIAKQGVLISEFPIGTTPKPGHFPRRNRIISGLSLGVLVVEASSKSGSLITARIAGEQGREVFAIPGSIHSPLSKGCHALIRNGAKLIETVAEILEEVKNHIDLSDSVHQVSLSANEPDLGQNSIDPDYEKVLNSMGYDPISIDNVIEQSGLGAEVVSSILLILELNGEITHNGNGSYVRSHQSL